MTDDYLLSPAQAKAREIEADSLADFESSVRWLMSDNRGRRFVYWLMDGVARTYSGSFSNNQLEMAFAEGRRDVGITVMKTCQQLAENDFLRMLAEQMAKRAANKAALENVEEPTE